MGLLDIHKLNIVLRDLKPENILLSTSGHIKLCDFGLSKKLKRNELTKSFVGTVNYEAPEIILQKGHDLVSDFWSLGVVLYELVCG